MKKTKLNWKNILLALIGTTFGVLFLTDWVIVLFKGAMFTWFGIATNMIYLGIACSIYNYFEEYIEAKEEKKRGM
jgi:hypothetical protein